MSSTSETGQEFRCPTCNHPVRPGTAFCANCGTSVSEITNVPPADTSDDVGATETYVPIGGVQSGTNQETQVERSPWAAPAPESYAEPGATATSTPFVPYTMDANSALPPANAERGIRGLVLGVVAIVLIAAVVALYVYDAWLSESARATVEGWIPW